MDTKRFSLDITLTLIAAYLGLFVRLPARTPRILSGPVQTCPLPPRSYPADPQRARANLPAPSPLVPRGSSAGRLLAFDIGQRRGQLRTLRRRRLPRQLPVLDDLRRRADGNRIVGD